MISHLGLGPGTTSRKYLVRHSKGWKGRYLPTSSARCLSFRRLPKLPFRRFQDPEGGDAGDWPSKDSLRLLSGLSEPHCLESFESTGLRLEIPLITRSSRLPSESQDPDIFKRTQRKCVDCPQVGPM